jgi:hypothetical protein
MMTKNLNSGIGTTLISAVADDVIFDYNGI